MHFREHLAPKNATADLPEIVLDASERSLRIHRWTLQVQAENAYTRTCESVTQDSSGVQGIATRQEWCRASWPPPNIAHRQAED